ncbi:MAG: hypothetical protein ACYC8T_08780 [Myxococcaceae bacterium]
MARAELKTEYKRSLTVNPVELFSGTFNLEYEQAINPAFSVYGGINYLYFQGVSRVDSTFSTVVGPEVGLRLYLIGDAPAGLWFGPYLGAAYVHNSSSSTPDSIGYGLGAMAGFNLVFNRVNLSLGLGTGWVDYSSMVDGRRVGLYGFIPRARVAVGVAF